MWHGKRSSRLLHPVWQRWPLRHLAFWQGLCFVALILLIWTHYTLNLGRLFYGADDAGISWVGACALTVCVVVVAFITMGISYLQGKRILRGFVTVCSYCHKVRIDEQMWNQMEEFVSDRTLVEFTHGICPGCFDKVHAELNAQIAGREAPPP